jgi:hypothetical protein
MGVVDLARDPDGREVALKRLTLKGSANEIARAHQRFTREATVLSRLHHPNIVRLLEVVEDGDEMVLVMPYLAGGSLADRVAQHGPAPPADVERLGERLLGALAAAHQAGIIHRDLKPANVLYDGDGEPMLADFGLAHTWDQTHGLTVAGMVVGTPGYMPPEQARDEPLTPATDIFSLGATLLFAATGNGPYGSGDPGLLMVRAANGEVQPVPKQLPKAMRGWLSAMLDPEPEYRPTAVALLTGQGLPPRRPTGWRRPRNLLAGSAAALAVVTVVAVGLNSRGSGENSNETAFPGTTGEAAAEDVPMSDPGDRLGDLFPGGDNRAEGPPATVGDDPAALPLVPGAQEEGRFSRPDEVLLFVVPPRDASPGASERACTGVVHLTLEIFGGARAAELRVLDEEGRPLVSDLAHPGEPARVEFDQELCEDEDGIRVQVLLEEATSDPGGFLLIRDDE